jgi:hypothetical protein
MVAQKMIFVARTRTPPEHPPAFSGETVGYCRRVTENATAARRIGTPARLLGFLAVLLALAVLAPAGARAGTYTLVSCTTPSGAPAPTDGWSTGVYGGGFNAPGSGDTNSCASGGALTALSSSDAQPASYTGPEWTFTAPAGMTIAGGTVTASMTAPQGQTWLGTPGGTFDGADVFASCQLDAGCGATGTASGDFAITHPGGTTIYAPALCISPGQPTCTAGGGSDGVNAEVAIHAATIELVTDAMPIASNLSGSLLTGPAHGTAELQFSAADPQATGGSGPGIYTATVAVDGATVYSGTPDTNHGACVPLGTDPADSALMFATAQPCKASEHVAVPVDTTALPDGSHTVTVTLTDAAGDTATVATKHFVSSNPITTRVPNASGGLQASFTLGFGWKGATTTLVTAGVHDLPGGGRVAFACTGRRCPRLSPATVPTARIGTLLAALKQVGFHAGDRVVLTVTAPRPKVRYRKVHGHKRRIAPAPGSITAPEHIRLTIRKGARPLSYTS